MKWIPEVPEALHNYATVTEQNRERTRNIVISSRLRLMRRQKR